MSPSPPTSRGGSIGRASMRGPRGRIRLLTSRRPCSGASPRPASTSSWASRSTISSSCSVLWGSPASCRATPSPPSGVSLAPEGGAHQSVITPGIGIALPGIVYWEPAFAKEVEWILLDGLARMARGEGESLYLRLSTRPGDQALAPPATPAVRAAVLAGGYRLLDARGEPGWDREDNAVSIFATGVMAPEALAAARALREEGLFASVFVATSPDLLHRGLPAGRGVLETLGAADD